MPTETLEQTQASQYDQLQQARFYNAEQSARLELNRALEDIGSLDHPRGALTGARVTGHAYDQGRTTADDLMMLDAFGIQPKHVLDSNGGLAEEVKLQEGDETAVLEPFQNGFVLSLKNDTFRRDPDNPYEEVPHSTDIARKVKQRYLASPIFSGLSELSSKAKEGGETNFVVQSLDLGSDKLGTVTGLVALEALDFLQVKDALRLVDESPDMATFINLVVENLRPGWNAVINQDGSVSIGGANKRHPKVGFSLDIDVQTGMANLGASTSSEEFYNETGDQNKTVSVPFIETECAREVIVGLEGTGLKFSRDFEDLITQTEYQNLRYGSVYTQITRELAKWVNSPNRTRPEKLFAPIQPAHDDESKQVMIEAILQIDTSEMGEPAQKIINIAKQVLSRDGSQEQPSDLRVCSQEASMSDGACFDVLYNFEGAINGELFIEKATEDGPDMLRKTNGKETFLTTQPIVFNGVELPKGSLFKKNDKGEWLFLRLTAYTFDTETDQIATGSELEYAKSVARTGRIGALSLSGLEQRAAT